jgi:hypothetical protein
MNVPSRLRRSVAAAALAAAGTSLLAAAPASAEQVTSLKPWKATNAYLVTADLDGRTQPRLNPVARVNHVKRGQWVRVTCQTRGQAAYGSTLWIKTGGLYVPDKFIKTYTDGPIAGVPRCGSSTEPQVPTPQTSPVPSGPSRAQLAAAVNAVAFERVYGSNVARYHELYPGRAGVRDIDWANNGCSVPQAILNAGRVPLPATITISRLLGYYSGVFEKSCDRHDFGYRNYGSDNSANLQLDPSLGRKTAIDARFHANMRYQCQTRFNKYNPARYLCYTAAQKFFEAVTLGGGPKFF